MHVHETEVRICPTCGTNMSVALNFDTPKAPPREGDLVICLECDALMRFEENLQIRLVTDEEMDDFDAEIKLIIQCGIVKNRQLRRSIQKHKEKENGLST